MKRGYTIMTSTYTPNTWSKGDKITSAKLNNIETGISDTLAVANSNSDKLDNIQSSIEDLAAQSNTTALAEKVTTLINHVAELETDAVSKTITNDGVKAQTNYNLVTNKVVTGSVTSTVWNESSGGGVQVKNTDANIISFIGVNNGQNDNNIWAQFYAKYINANSAKGQVKNSGTRVNFTQDGVFYTRGKTSGAYTESDELVTKATTDQLLQRITELEARIAALEGSGS